MGTALWLSFRQDSNAHKTLSNTIDVLSEALGRRGIAAAKFKPHMTITSALTEEVICALNDEGHLDTDLQLSYVDVTRSSDGLSIGRLEFNSEVYFKNVVFNVAIDSTLLNFIRIARGKLTVDKNVERWLEAYQPHISVAYSTASFENGELKQEVTRIVRQNLSRLSHIDINDCILEVVRCEGPPEQWETLLTTS